MEIWTRRSGGDFSRWPDAVQGVESLAGAPAVAVLFYSEAPDSEAATLAAALRLARRFAGEECSLAVSSPHPSQEWIDAARRAGADRILVTQGDAGGRRGRVPLGRALEVEPCPALHVWTDGSTTLSVCGRHRDRMVLCQGHLERWCLGHNDACPHWRDGIEQG